MNDTDDYSEAEQKLVSSLLFKRYGKLVLLQLADVELQLGSDPEKSAFYPALYWSERGANFVVCKISARCYRCQFFYSDAEQFGAGRDEYIDLETCVQTLLKVQADHERQLANTNPHGAPVEPSSDDYRGPLVV